MQSQTIQMPYESIARISKTAKENMTAKHPKKNGKTYKSLRKRYLRYALNLEPASCAKALNRLMSYENRNVEFGYQSSLFSVKDTQTLYVSERSRLAWYFDGIDERLKTLEEQYLLQLVDLQEGNSVLDCGANIGEFGVLLRHLFPPVRYIAFEPSESDKLTCEKNNPDGEVHLLGLWNRIGQLDLYLKTDTADSSFVEIADFSKKISTPITTIDDLFQKGELKKIHLLKLEAEGGEPEVLQGAEKSLEHIKYITADLGPERGISQDNTVASVTNTLTSRGYRMLGFNPVRQVCLFENMDFSE